MNENPKVLERLKHLDFNKKLKLKIIKEDAKFLDDEHSVLRLKTLIDEWRALDFEFKILLKFL